MTSNIKRILISILSTIFVFCTMLSLWVGFGGNVQADAFTATTSYSFEMKDGASAKVAKFNEGVDNALRFVTTLKTTDLPEGDGVKVVTIITLAESLNANNINSEKGFILENLDENEIKYLSIEFSKANGNLTSLEKEGNYVYNACVYNIKDENFTKNFAARSYITDASGNVTQYTAYDSTKNVGSIWNVADSHKESADTTEEVFGPNANMTERAYIETLCQTHTLTVDKGDGEMYTHDIKHGQKIAHYVSNKEFSNGVAKVANFSYPTAYLDENGIDCYGKIITEDLTLTAVYGEEGSVQVSDGVVTGVGTTFFNYTTEIVVPETCDAGTITSIGKCAFMAHGDTIYKAQLTKITMSSSVTAIEGYAFFGCSKLETVIMPGVTKITADSSDSSWNHFYNCTSLKTIVTGESFSVIAGNITEAAQNRIFYTTGSNKVSVYLTSANGTLSYFRADHNNMFSDDLVFHYSKTEQSGCWYYDTDGSINIWA